MKFKNRMKRVVSVTVAIVLAMSMSVATTQATEVTPIPTVTPEPTLTVKPTAEPTAEPTPSVTPEPTPTAEPTPSVTLTPTESPIATIELDVTPTPIPTPTINIGINSVDNKLANVLLGESHTWIISTDVPVDIANGKSFVIMDTLNAGLVYKDVIIRVEYIGTVVEGADPISPLVLSKEIEEADYTLNLENNTVTVTLTEKGMAAIAEKVSSVPTDYKIRVYLQTELNTDVVWGTNISNQASLRYINSQNSESVVPSETATIYTCGICVTAVDSATKSILSGVTFNLVKVAEEGDTNKYSLRISDTETIDVVDVPFYTEGTNTTPDVVTTGENGIANLYNLKEGTYYLVEVSTKAGYNLLTYPIQVEVTAEINSESYIKEVTIANSTVFKLPDTGGIGTVIFTVGGAILIGGAVILLILNKRKENEEE